MKDIFEIKGPGSVFFSKGELIFGTLDGFIGKPAYNKNESVSQFIVDLLNTDEDDIPDIDNLREYINYAIDVLDYHTNYGDNFSKLDALEKLTIYTTLHGTEELIDTYEEYLPNLLKVKTYYGIMGKINDFRLYDDNEVFLDAIQKMKIPIPKEDFSAYFENIYHLFFIVLYLCISDNIYIKRCAHCNSYFIPKNRNAIYCTNIAKNETKPCNKIGAIKKFEMQKTSSTAAYRKIENKINLRISRLRKTYPRMAEKLTKNKKAFHDFWKVLKAKDLTEEEKIKELDAKYAELFPKE